MPKDRGLRTMASELKMPKVTSTMSRPSVTEWYTPGCLPVPLSILSSTLPTPDLGIDASQGPNRRERDNRHYMKPTISDGGLEPLRDDGPEGQRSPGDPQTQHKKQGLGLASHDTHDERHHGVVNLRRGDPSSSSQPSNIKTHCPTFPLISTSDSDTKGS